MKAIIIHCHDNVNLAADIQIVIINSRLQARNNEKPIRTETRSKETGTLVGAFSLLITEDILSQIIVNANISVNICNVDIYQIPPTTLSLSLSVSLSLCLSLSLSAPFWDCFIEVWFTLKICTIHLLYSTVC